MAPGDLVAVSVAGPDVEAIADELGKNDGEGAAAPLKVVAESHVRLCVGRLMCGVLILWDCHP